MCSIALLFFAAIHYVQPDGGGYGLHLSINNATWIAVAFILCVAVAQWEQTKKIKLAKSDFALTFVIVGLAIPLFWSESPWRQTAYGRYAAILAFWMLVVSARQFTFSRAQQKFFWGIIVSGVLIQCIVGLFQFFWANEVSFIGDDRPSGSFQQVNVYASFIATGLAISIYQLCSQPLEKPFKVLYYLMLFFAGLLETLVMSRVGILGCALALVSFCFLFRLHKKQMLIITVIIISGVLAAVMMKSSNESSFRGADRLTNTSARVQIYKTSIEIIKEAPLLGGGLGRFHSMYLEKQAETSSSDSTILLPISASDIQIHPHNEILFWWVEGGIIPVLAILIFAMWFSIRVWRHGTINHKAAWLCCIPIILHTQTEYPLYHSVPHLAMLGLLVSQASPCESKQYESSFNLLPKFLYALFALVCVFMLTNLQTTWLIRQYIKTSETQFLPQIINPFAQQQKINYIYSSMFLEIKNTEFLPAAEEMMATEAKVRPSENAFKYLYNIQQLLPNSDLQQEKTRHRAEYLFPNSIVFKDNGKEN